MSVCNSCGTDLSNLFSRKERELEIFTAKLFKCTFFLTERLILFSFKSFICQREK